MNGKHGSGKWLLQIIATATMAVVQLSIHLPRALNFMSFSSIGFSVAGLGATFLTVAFAIRNVSAREASKGINRPRDCDATSGTDSPADSTDISDLLFIWGVVALGVGTAAGVVLGNL